jgi:uncharacterized membrane protein required for colicin V production
MVENVMVAISVLAILAILGLGRLGMFLGAFYEVTSTVSVFLAMMISLRYWYLLTRWAVSWCPPDAVGYATFGSYWVLFLLGCLPLLAFMSRVTEVSIPKYPKVVDAVLGLVFGTISATVIVCCVMTSLSVVGPKIWEEYNHEALVLPLDKVPIEVYQAVERKWLHIGTNDCAHTRFPTFDKADVDNFDKYWK